MEGNIVQKHSRLKVYILKQSELTHFSLPELWPGEEKSRSDFVFAEATCLVFPADDTVVAEPVDVLFPGNGGLYCFEK